MRFKRWVRRVVRRLVGDPPVLLEEMPLCPALFHYYRQLLTTGHQRVAGGWKYEGRFYADYLTIGGACFGAVRTAQKWCQGDGIDVGAGAWPFPGARPIDPGSYPNGLKLEDIEAGSQDYVFTSHTLEHIKDWGGFCGVLAEKLKPGGILFTYLPHPECGLWRMENPFMRQYHEWVPEPAVVKQGLISVGLEIVDFDDGPDVMMSFFVCARKPLAWVSVSQPI